MRGKLSVSMVLLIILSTVLSACQMAPPQAVQTVATQAPAKAAEQAAPAAKKIETQIPVDVPRDQVYVIDQIFRYSVVNNFNLWNPTGGSTPTRQGLVMDSLWYLDQETAAWINSLAADKPQYNSDFTEMTVKLRPGVMWSDGVEFTADDLVYTVNTLKNTPGLAWSAEMKLYVKDVQKVDNYTVKFTLNEPNPRFAAYFTVRYNGLYMMPKHVAEKQQDLLSWTNYPPTSLGAYMPAESDPNGYWELFKLRDDWQKTTPGIVTGKAGPQYILTIFYGANERKAIAMARHDLDLMMDIDYEAFNAILSSTPTARSWFKDFPWAYPNELDCRWFGFNWTIPPYDNKDVRWALALALDIVDLQTNYIGGVARLNPLPVPATNALMKVYHVPMTPWLQEFTIDVGNGEKFAPFDPDAPKRVADWAAKQGYTVATDPDTLLDRFGIGTWKYAPDVAEKLLTKNGFTKDAQGKWLLPDGKPWKITIISAPDEVDVQRLAIGAQDQWRKFGIDVAVDSLERDPYYQRQNLGQFEVTSTWSPFTVNADGDLWQGLNSLHSRFFAPVGTSDATTGSANDQRFVQPGLDEIVDEMAKLTPDNPKVVELGQEALKLMITNALFLNTTSFKKFITMDEYYWTGWPTSEHPDRQPLYWFQGGRFSLPYVTPVGQ
jgi:peptide/nickel transport system substrate-binding protein